MFYISVLKYSILAIILFEYLLLNPSAKRGIQIVQGTKIPEVHETPFLLLPPPLGLPSGVALIQQYFKRHCYVAANKSCIGFLKAHFLSFFARLMGGVGAGSNALKF